MYIDWQHIQAHITSGVRVRWPRGVLCHPTWARVFQDELLILFLHGRAVIRLREGPVACQAGTLLWLTPGYAYDIEQDPQHPTETMSLHFLLRDGKGREVDLQPHPPECLLHADAEAAGFVVRRVLGLFDSRMREQGGLLSEHRLQAEAWLKALLIELERVHYRERLGVVLSSAKPNTIQQSVLAWAHRVLLDPAQAPSIQDTAREAGCSRGHFHKTARALLRCSPQQFVVRHRMLAAQRLLVETERTIAHVADRCGYADVYAFSKAFKAATGYTPGQFRRWRSQTEVPSVDFGNASSA